MPVWLRTRGRTLLRYGAVSAISTTVGLSTLAVLVSVGGWPAGWANVVATALGTIPSFELNRRWVWGRTGQRSVGGEVTPFVAYAFAELVLSSLAVHAVALWTRRLGWAPSSRTAADLAANVATFGALWVGQYIVCDRLLFGRGRSREDGSPA